MASTYSNNPAASDKDAVRFLCKDTGPTVFLVTDEEIEWLLSTEANLWMAAAMVCDKLTTLATSGGVSSKSIGPLSESYSEASVGFYQGQAKLFRQRGKGHQVPFFEDIDPIFSMGQFDNPEATDRGDAESDEVT